MTTPQVTNVFSSKSDVAYSELRRLILSGDLPAGSRLAQYELAEQMRMSITPLREAIRRLSSEGLIELDNHKDARVSTISGRRGTPTLRGSAGPGSRRRGAGRRAPHRRRHRPDAHHRRPTATRSPGNGAKTRWCAHSDFHRALYVASHNDVMIKMLDDLWAKSDRYRRLGLELPAGEEPRTIDLNEHHEILELVVAQRRRRRGALTRRHIQNSLTAAAISALEGRDHAGSVTA